MKKLFLSLVTVSLFSAQATADIKHFVAFKYKESINLEQRLDIAKKFLELKAEAVRNGKNYIISIETGKANSKEGFDQNMDQGFIVTFKNESDRDYYVGKPFSAEFDIAHDKFKQFVGPFLSVDDNGNVNGVYVFDFKTNTI